MFDFETYISTPEFETFLSIFNKYLNEIFEENVKECYKQDGLDVYTDTNGWELALEKTCNEMHSNFVYQIINSDLYSWQQREEIEKFIFNKIFN